jgi:cellulose biosynthesis protein BcsQ
MSSLSLAEASLAFGDLLQGLKIIGEYLHGLYAIPIVGFAVWQWFRIQFLKRKAKDAAKHIDRVELAANQNEEESIWGLSPPSPPLWFSQIAGGLELPVIAVGNLKGGVGKTTTTAYLAHCFSRMGLRVLAIDLDYQGSLTDLLQGSSERLEDNSGISKLMSVGDHQIIFSDDVITRLNDSAGSISLIQNKGSMSLIKASSDFSALENRLQLRWLLERDKDDVRYRLAYHLSSKQVREQFDVILLDTPPRMTAGTFNALIACSHVVIPTTLKRASWDRVPSYYKLLKNIAGTYNPRLAVAGIAITLTKQEPAIVGSELDSLNAFKMRLNRAEIFAPVLSRHIPRWDALGDADFTNENAVKIYDTLAHQVWEEIKPNQRKAA